MATKKTKLKNVAKQVGKAALQTLTGSTGINVGKQAAAALTKKAVSKNQKMVNTANQKMANTAKPKMSSAQSKAILSQGKGPLASGVAVNKTATNKATGTKTSTPRTSSTTRIKKRY